MPTRPLTQVLRSVLGAGLLAATSALSLSNGLAAQETIKIGEFASLTGKEAVFGQNAHKGTLLAIEMAHHYLGHHKKYGPPASAAGNAPEPFTEKLTEKEWREAVFKGARNALDCGLGVDGFRAILAAVEKLPTRPKWSAYLVHPKADISKLSRELEKLEKDFFLVDK